MSVAQDGDAPRSIRKPYLSPELVQHGGLEKLTGWVGGPWGEFFGGSTGGLTPLEDPLGDTGS